PAGGTVVRRRRVHGARGARFPLRRGAGHSRLPPRRPGRAPPPRRRVRQRRRRSRQAIARRAGLGARRDLSRTGTIRRMNVADRLLVSTRKGLFTFVRDAGTWRARNKAFVGENVTLALADSRVGWFAALNMGHFGVKLRHSANEGETWEERAVPVY